MATIAELAVSIGADMSDFQKDMDDFGKQMGKMGDKMQGIGEGMSKALTVPLAAIGGISMAAASEFDEASAIIRNTTGATGDELSGLEESFKTVFKGGPESAEEVATAMADLRSRTGLTGTALEELTTQVIDLADVTGTDLKPLVADATRLFENWNVAGADTGKTLDYLFKVGQNTGVGVDTLTQNMVKFGEPLRQVGFDLETSAALLGKWEKEGINAEAMLGGLRKAVASLAEAGQEPTVELPKLIEAIKAAGTESEANAIAMGVFGAKAGVDMAAAIRDGKFAVDDMVASLNASNETIAKADAESETFAEKLGILKNQASAAFEPLGAVLTDMAINILPAVSGAMEKVVGWFGNLNPTSQKIIVVIGLVLAVMGPLLMILGSIAGAVSTLIPIITGFSIASMAAVWPVLAVIAAIAALIAIIIAIIENWDFLKAKTIEVFQAIQNKVGTVIDSVKSSVKAGWDWVKTKTESIFGGVSNFVTGVWEGILSTIKGVVNGILKAMNFMIRGLNKLKFTVPDWVPGIGGKGFGFNLSEIPYLASGAIAYGPTLAMIGEGSEPEALLPLSRLDAMLENAGGGGGGTQYNNFNVSIPVDDLEELNTVKEFFDYLKQRKRAR